MSQRAYIQFSHAVAIYRFSPRGKKMPHRYNGQLWGQLCTFLFSQSAHLCIVIADTLYQLSFLLLDALASLGQANISIPQIRHGADDQLRRTIRSAENEDLIFPVLRD